MKKVSIVGLAIVGIVAFALLFVHFSADGPACGDLPCPLIELPKEELARALGDPERLKSSVGMTPRFESGRFAGFELIRVAPDSMIARIGLREGDVIRSVGGVSLDSPEAVMAAYDALKGKSQAEVQMERGRTTHRFTIQAK